MTISTPARSISGVHVRRDHAHTGAGVERAPAAWPAATGPPPTSTTSRPASVRKSGSRSGIKAKSPESGEPSGQWLRALVAEVLPAVWTSRTAAQVAESHPRQHATTATGGRLEVTSFLSSTAIVGLPVKLHCIHAASVARSAAALHPVRPAAACSPRRSAPSACPPTATPEHYDLAFVVDIAGQRFDGTETIRVRIDQPTTRIVLHAAELDFQEVTISAGGTTQQRGRRARPRAETATLTVDSAAAGGTGRDSHPLHRRAERPASRVLHQQGRTDGATPSRSSNRPMRGAPSRASTSRRSRPPSRSR